MTAGRSKNPPWQPPVLNGALRQCSVFSSTRPASKPRHPPLVLDGALRLLSLHERLDIDRSSC